MTLVALELHSASGWQIAPGYSTLSLRAMTGEGPAPLHVSKSRPVYYDPFTLNNATDLHTSYPFSRADYGQHNFAEGLPLGIRYQKHAVTAGLAGRISKKVSARLRYGFYKYDEPSSGGANNYTAHPVFGTLVFRLP